ncbi:hypothetical protein A3K63_01425 [Candidatus Micrarchaeota archaeon RBG_16_49_10]|nr:MAG: hypothetical protein A3K63_01425 [Candidatus Micrarchaeota archaeon RBG_16_49_10]
MYSDIIEAIFPEHDFQQDHNSLYTNRQGGDKPPLSLLFYIHVLDRQGTPPSRLGVAVATTALPIAVLGPTPQGVVGTLVMYCVNLVAEGVQRYRERVKNDDRLAGLIGMVENPSKGFYPVSRDLLPGVENATVIVDVIPESGRESAKSLNVSIPSRVYRNPHAVGDIVYNRLAKSDGTLLPKRIELIDKY